MKHTLLQFKHPRQNFKTSYFLLNPSINGIFKNSKGVQNQLPISFGTALECKKIVKLIYFPRTHTNF